MTYKEVFDLMHAEMPELQMDIDEEAINVILDALEKQIPKKVISIENLCVCPSCGAMLETKRMNIARGNIGCPCCLQVIDWGEEE